MKRTLVPGQVSSVTHTARYGCLALALAGLGALSVIRALQRLQWLMVEFRPAGLPFERPLMALTEGSAFLSAALGVLLALSAVLLPIAARRGAGLMRMTLSVHSALSLLAALGLACVTVGGAWVCVHYRLSVTLLGYTVVLGVLIVIAMLIRWRYFHNASRVAGDIAATLRRGGGFAQGRGVRCRIQTQAILLAMITLIPVAVVLLGGAALAWGINQLLRPVIGAVAADELLRLLSHSATSPMAMYAVECAEGALRSLALLLTIPVYRAYMRAHREQPPRYWKPHTHGAAVREDRDDARRFTA